MTDQPPLARTALDRAAHRRTDPDWLEEAYKRGLVLVLDLAAHGRAAVTADSELILLEADQAPAGDPAQRMFLGLVDGDTPVFAVVGTPPQPPPGGRVANLREVGHLLSDRDLGLLTTAHALANWHQRHGFSAVTGHPTFPTEGGWVRRDADGEAFWPRTDPAMIVLVHDGVPGPGGRCLLGHNAGWPTVPQRRFSCLAGFVEPGESAEGAVAREVLEEVGIQIRDISYVGSQPWPFPGSLMLGFTALADPAQPLVTDPAEIAEARWFTREQINGVLANDPAAPFGLAMSVSIAYYLISRWARA